MALAIDPNEGETEMSSDIMMSFTIWKTWFMKEITNGINSLKIESVYAM